MAKAKAKKREKAKPVGKTKSAMRAKPKKVVVKKKDIENSLANMAAWCSTLRLALEAYDPRKDRAILYSPPPPELEPPHNEVVDCPPPEEDPGCCCCALTPEVVELLNEYLKVWKRKKRGQTG